MRALVLALAVALAGCSQPEPPKLTPEQAKVTSISPAGIALNVRLEAYNPNSVDLSARKVVARVKLDGRIDLGTVKVPTALNLPAQRRTKLDVPLSLKWSDLSFVIALATSNRSVPYEVDGTVELGGDAFSVDVPFRMGGTISHDELVRATANSLPKISIPGIP
jgi:LEA14-like dessication related protein